MNRVERLYRLHGLLKARRPMSLQSLTQELAVSRATLVRDIGYLRDYMGAPIVYNREVNGYRYDPQAEDFELPGLWFNDSELYALLASEQLLEAVQPGLLGPYIGPLKQRIRKLLEQSGHTSETVSSRILLQPVARRRVDMACFGAVSEALFDSRVIDVEYHGRERDQVTRRRVHPARLLHYRDNWYLIAWCERAQAIRTFSLDRIRNVQTTTRPVRSIDENALSRHIGASFGIFTGEAKAWARLRFSAHRAEWVAEESWHPDQLGHWHGEQYELQIPYSDQRELLMDILKYGPDVEVLAPPELRHQTAEYLQKAAKKYEKPD